MQATYATAIFQVADLERSLSFYEEKLGFARDFVYGEPAFYAGLCRDKVGLHLNSIGENASRVGQGCLYIYCDEVDDYYGLLVERGVEVTSPLDSQPYGMRDFQVSDPDGNLVCFGKAVEPFGEGN